MIPFDHHPRTRLVFGPNSVDRVGDLARELGAQRVLIVTDPGLVRAGHADRVEAALARAGLAVNHYDQVRENPTTLDVDRCVEAARISGADTLVGLGGGSSMDTAKGCNFILTNGGCMKDYWGVGKAAHRMLPLIAVPTTAGTGSECQSFALIADDASHQKMACGDPKAAPRIAILDPTLTLSQPQAVTAHTGIDALTHAVETAVTKARNSYSLMHAHRAFQLIVPGLPRVLGNPSDLEARGWMLLGAALAGLAIESSMLGAAHSAANPLTARFNVVHGEAVGIMLPAVIRFNAVDPAVRRSYAELASAAELGSVSGGVDAASDALVREVERLLNLAGIAPSLAPLGVAESDLSLLATEAAGQWTAGFNPRPIAARDFLELYRSVMVPRA